jgi:predicted dehydrogenase
MNIGLIGAENSHARHFCKVINGEKPDPGFSITNIYGADNPKEAEALSSEFGLSLSKSEDEVIEKSDAVAITYRKGSLHYVPAMKVLRAGKPLFNDKPFAASAKEAREIVNYAQKHGILLTGGSSVKSLPGLKAAAAKIRNGTSVILSYAADPKSEYDGYRFYGVHSVEMCLALFGTEYLSVDAFRNGNVVVSVIRYAENQCTLVTSPDSAEIWLSFQDDSGVSHKNIPMDYQSICPKEFITMLKKGKPPREYQWYVKATEILDKIIKSAGL